MSDGTGLGDDLPSIAKAAKTFVGGAVAIVGGLVTLAGVWSSSMVVALNVSGVIGVATLTIGGLTWVSASSSDPIRRIRTTAIVVSATALVAGLIFAVGRPLEDGELEFGLLTIIGIANLLAVGTLGILTWRTIALSARPATKTCPDCAETVLAAAVKCKHCGYRFPATS